MTSVLADNTTFPVITITQTMRNHCTLLTFIFFAKCGKGWAPVTQSHSPAIMQAQRLVTNPLATTGGV